MATISGEQAVQAFEQLQKLIDDGYIIRIQKVDRKTFAYGRSFIEDKKAFSCEGETFIDCMLKAKDDVDTNL